MPPRPQISGLLAQQTRRHFLRSGSLGLGAGAGVACGRPVVGQAGRKERSVRPPAGAFPAQGEERHHAEHVGRAAASGSVRLQARAGQTERRRLPGVADRRQAVRIHRTVGQAVGHAAKVPATRPERRLGVGRAAPDRVARRRTDVHQVDADRPVQPWTGRAAAIYRHSAHGRAAVVRFLGHLRVGLARIAICRASSCSFPAARSPAWARPAGGAAFCRRCIRACNAAPAAIRCCTCPIPRG